MPVIFATQTVYLLRFIFLFFVLLALTEIVSAQSSPDSGIVPLKDTLPVTDTPATIHKGHKDTLVRVQQDTLSITQTNDSVSKQPLVYPTWEINSTIPLSIQLLQHHPYFGFGSKPVIIHSDVKEFKGKEILFYTLIGLLLSFAFLRQAFPKYFNDFFRLLFRTTLKQKQIREQLMQTPLPSLLLNVFFVVSGGLYIDLILHHFRITPINNFWLLFLYCSLGLSVIYTVKFLGLKVTGWIFNIKAAADAYIFVVFIINKVIGVFLLPFLVLLSFIQGDVYTVALVLSWFGIGVLFIYRFLLTYASVRNQVRFNPFHFFLYLCAFEVAPLLLIYKALLFFFR
jgi:Domain of unknown function (DUF4271)